jgi:hypothetical protein
VPSANKLLQIGVGAGGVNDLNITTTLMAWLDPPMSVLAMMRPAAAASREL